MKRRDFLRLGWATVIGTGFGTLRPAFAESLRFPPVSPASKHSQMAMSEPMAAERAADFTLRIAPTIVELAPQVAISTIGYNGKVPGPLMRVREGQPVTVDVMNDTDIPELCTGMACLSPRKPMERRKRAPLRSASRRAAISIRRQSGWLAMVPLAHQR